MPNFIITYRGQVKPKNPEQGKAHVGKWRDWISSLGDAIINPGTPLKEATIITANGISQEPNPNAMGGFMIFTADDMEAAIKIAQGDPYLEMESATLELAQIIEMG